MVEREAAAGRLISIFPVRRRDCATTPIIETPLALGSIFLRIPIPDPTNANSRLNASSLSCFTPQLTLIPLHTFKSSRGRFKKNTASERERSMATPPTKPTASTRTTKPKTKNAGKFGKEKLTSPLTSSPPHSRLLPLARPFRVAR